VASKSASQGNSPDVNFRSARQYRIALYKGIGMPIKVGNYQAWIERTKRMEWTPHIETKHGSTFFWFLNIHAIWDKA